MKKIAFVNVFYAPQSLGGATRVLEDNIHILQEKYADDFELVVFASDAEHIKTKKAMSIYSHSGLRVYKAPIVWQHKMDWYYKDPIVTQLFDQFLEIEQPDIVHFHCLQRLGAEIIEMTRNRSIPYFITAHDAWWISDFQFLIDHLGQIHHQAHPNVYANIDMPPGVSVNDSICRKNYLKQLMLGADKMLTVSESFMRIYHQNGITNCITNKNGISNKVQWGNKDTSFTDRVVCGFIGGLANHKGYFLFKDAIQKIKGENIEVLLVDSSQKLGYSELSHWGDTPVTTIGYVNQDEITELYQRIDVLFAPSKWPESYGLVTREAAACGCWIVASNLGGIGEDVTKDSGFVINPDLESVAKTIGILNSNPKKYKAVAGIKNYRRSDQQVIELVKHYNGVFS